MREMLKRSMPAFRRETIIKARDRLAAPPVDHFGLRTVTNSYANKDLSKTHPNIISIRDVTPDMIATTLAKACREFEANPEGGWLAATNKPSFLETGPFPFLKQLSADLAPEVRGQSTPLVSNAVGADDAR